MSNYNTENYSKQGGDHWIVGENGFLTVNGNQTNKSLNFDTTNEESPVSIGELRWNNGDRALDLKVSDEVTAQLPQEHFLPRSVNKIGAKISNGKAVYVDTAQGNRPSIALANASTYATSFKTIGIATEDIEDNAEGFVVTSGLARGLDTSAWSAGTCLYLSTTDGELTETQPSDGNMRIFVAMVITSHATNGVLCVRIQRDKYMFGDIDNGNYSYFESDGTLKFVGNATVYEDDNAGGITLTKAAANQPDLVTIDSTSILTYAFDGGAAMEELHWATEIPHSYKEGTDLIPHAHIYPTTTGAGNIKFFLEYWVKSNGGTAVTGTASFVVAAGGTAWEESRENFDSVIDGSTLTIADQAHFRIYRDPTDAEDTYADDVAIGTLGYHYEIDTIGSRGVVTK